jgi:hypothetical protein
VAAAAATDVAAVVVVAVEVEVEVEVVGAVVCVSSPASVGEVHAAPARAGAVHAAPADAEASSLEAVSAALPVAAAEAVPHLAGYGRQLGAGSTAVGVALHQQVNHLASHRSKSRRRWRPRKQLTEKPPAHVRNSGSAAPSVN